VSTFKLNEAEVTWVLEDPDGPVGDYLRKTTEEMAAIARARVPVRRGNVWSERTTSARKPGFTKSSIHTVMGRGASGSLWGSVNAEANPGLWLEFGAEQMHHRHPFLSTALFTATSL
jgi:hypothetical protein